MMMPGYAGLAYGFVYCVVLLMDGGGSSLAMILTATSGTKNAGRGNFTPFDCLPVFLSPIRPSIHPYLLSTIPLSPPNNQSSKTPNRSPDKWTMNYSIYDTYQPTIIPTSPPALQPPPPRLPTASPKPYNSSNPPRPPKSSPTARN